MNKYVIIKGDKIFIKDIVSFTSKKDVIDIILLKRGKQSYSFKNKEEVANVLAMLQHFINKKSGYIVK